MLRPLLPRYRVENEPTRPGGRVAHPFTKIRTPYTGCPTLLARFGERVGARSLTTSSPTLSAKDADKGGAPGK